MIGPSSFVSKTLLSALFLVCGWYIFMDVTMYLRIQNYKVNRNFMFNTTPDTFTTVSTTYYKSTANNAITPATIVDSYGNRIQQPAVAPPPASPTIKTRLRTTNDQQEHYEDVAWISCDINPLCHITVKAIMLDHTNQYLFAPMATIFDNIIGFSRTTWITPNLISFFHVFVAIAAGRFIASDSLCQRRFGVVLFQFRTFLDDLDGHVARKKKNILGERSEIGTAGYYIDGLCDGLGCVALMIGIFVHLKNNPPRRGYTQLQPILPTSIGGVGGGTDSKMSCTTDSGVIYKVKVTTKKVIRKVLCFSGQLLLSSTGWNRYIALYQDMLERDDVTPIQYGRQNVVFKSKWFFTVAWLWRIVNVHALLHCLLLSIFCDKLWEFLRMIQYVGFIVLLAIICATEMHVLDVQNFIFQTLTGNNTSL